MFGIGAALDEADRGCAGLKSKTLRPTRVAPPMPTRTRATTGMRRLLIDGQDRISAPLARSKRGKDGINFGRRRRSIEFGGDVAAGVDHEYPGVGSQVPLVKPRRCRRLGQVRVVRMATLEGLDVAVVDPAASSLALHRLDHLRR